MRVPIDKTGAANVPLYRLKYGFFTGSGAVLYPIDLLGSFQTLKDSERITRYSTPIFILIFRSNQLAHNNLRQSIKGKSARFFNNIIATSKGGSLD